jgi:hypothetical protein
MVEDQRTPRGPFLPPLAHGRTRTQLRPGQNQLDDTEKLLVVKFSPPLDEVIS